MANLDLTKYGITGTTEIVHNPSYELLFEEETKPELVGYEKGQVSELGAVNVMTGVYTGRSPKDKYIVMDENGFISLTDKGMSIASAVYEKHTVLSRWLVSLGVDPKTAAEDACRMEHVISQESFTKLKEHAEKCHFEE